MALLFLEKSLDGSYSHGNLFELQVVIVFVTAYLGLLLDMNLRAMDLILVSPNSAVLGLQKGHHFLAASPRTNIGLKQQPHRPNS